MPFLEFEKIQEQYKVRAQEWLKNNADLELQENLRRLSYKDLYSSEAHDLYYGELASICEDAIAEFVDDHHKPSVDSISEAVNNAFYRMLTLTDKEPDKNWMTKCIVRSKIDKKIGYSLVEKLGIKTLDRSDIESRMSDNVLKTPLGESTYGFWDTEGIPLQNDIQSFVDAGNFKELTEYLYFLAKNCDGVGRMSPKAATISHGVSESLRRITGRQDIDHSDISTLFTSGDLVPKSLWDTQHFHDSMAPVVTDELVDQYRPQINVLCAVDYSKLELLKDQLSDKEIFNCFIRSNMSERSSWHRAMVCYEIITGKRLTFKQAQEMNPKYGFTLQMTQPYNDHIDNTYDADSYLETSVEITDCDDYDSDEDCIYKTVFINSKICDLDDVRESIEQKLTQFEYTKEWAGGPDFLKVTMEMDADTPLSVLGDFCKDMLDCIQENISTAILPGDVVMIECSEQEDLEVYGLKNGAKFVVTDIGFDGKECKLKGINDYIPKDMLKLRLKHQPENDVEASFVAP